MAKDCSFDVVSEFDKQELVNAVDQVKRDVTSRFDLKNTNLTQEEIEEKYQIKSRTRLYDINWGKVGKKLFPQESYPLRVGIKNQKPKYLSNPVETILVIEE